MVINRFYIDTKFDKLLSEIDHVLQKEEFKLTKSAKQRNIT